MRDIRLLTDPFDPARAITNLAAAMPQAGAIASFVGQVRDGDGAVEALELSHYEPLTLPGMQELADRITGMFALDGLVLLHRIGMLAPGNPIVCVAAAARQRRAAFEAVDYAMDHLKSAAWFWKRERRAGEWHWIAPRSQDYADLARWDAKKSAV